MGVLLGGAGGAGGVLLGGAGGAGGVLLGGVPVVVVGVLLGVASGAGGVLILPELPSIFPTPRPRADNSAEFRLNSLRIV